LTKNFKKGVEMNINLKRMSLEELNEMQNAIEIEKKSRKCKCADQYKGIHPPKCNNGNPCQECVEKYNENHPKKPLGKVIHYGGKECRRGYSLCLISCKDLELTDGTVDASKVTCPECNTLIRKYRIT